MTEKFVIFSDVHGRADRVRELVSRHRDASTFLFLGDGLRDLDGLDFSPVAVCGNCDLFSTDTPEELFLDLGGKKILLMHGHRLSVKSGLDRALAYASARGADALLFGHTHLPEEAYFPEGTALSDGTRLARPMWAFNPGSLGEPRGGKPSYGLLQIRNGQMLFSHGTL
ncbi:MAG: metallophosphoesterase family protein [Clostridia bacterium]|nr:metallophosphoesterase family protein [Clostridia bacterium]